MLLVCCNFLLYYKYESYLSTYTRKRTPLKIYVTCQSFSETFFDFSIKEMSDIYDFFFTILCIKMSKPFEMLLDYRTNLLERIDKIK